MRANACFSLPDSYPQLLLAAVSDQPDERISVFECGFIAPKSEHRSIVRLSPTAGVSLLKASKLSLFFADPSFSARQPLHSSSAPASSLSAPSARPKSKPKAARAERSTLGTPRSAARAHGGYCCVPFTCRQRAGV